MTETSDRFGQKTADAETQAERIIEAAAEKLDAEMAARVERMAELAIWLLEGKATEADKEAIIEALLTGEADERIADLAQVAGIIALSMLANMKGVEVIS